MKQEKNLVLLKKNLETINTYMQNKKINDLTKVAHNAVLSYLSLLYADGQEINIMYEAAAKKYSRNPEYLRQKFSLRDIRAHLRAKSNQKKEVCQN